MQKGIIYTLLLALLVLTGATSLPTKNFTFTGKITDSAGESLIGASVLVKGTEKGTVTDFDGKFSFTDKDSCLTIIASYTGFESKETKVCAGESPIVIALTESVELSEVVVTARSVRIEKKTMGLASRAVGTKSRPKRRKRAESVEDAFMRGKPISKDAEYDMAYAEPGTPPRSRMTAGQLTAAEWNDLKNWEDWLDVSKEDLGEWAKVWKTNPGKRYSVIVRNEDNTPIPNATVQLIDKKGTAVWQSLTDNTGRAELWLKSGKAAKVTVSHQGETTEIKKPKAYNKGINNVHIKSECPTTGGVEVVFAVDATGSMGDEIAYLQAELMDVLERVTKTPVIENLRTGAVFYRDHEDEYLVRKSPLSDGSKKTLAFIDKQSAGGGGDNPEAVEVGLEAAIEEMDWSEGAIARIVFFVLDAPPHNQPEIQQKMNTLMSKAAAKGIRIIPMLASNSHGETEYLMRTLAIGTNGRLLFLTDDSGIGDPHAEPSVGPYRVEKANDLMFRLILEFAAFKPCEDDDNNQYQVVNSQNDKLEVSCYPIPANEFVLADLKTTADRVEIIDAQGKVIMTTEDLPIGVTSIDIANLVPGTYYMKFTKGENVETVTIVKV